MSFASSVLLNQRSGSVIEAPPKEVSCKPEERPGTKHSLSPASSLSVKYLNTKDGEHLFKAALTSKIGGLVLPME